MKLHKISGETENVLADSLKALDRVAEKIDLHFIRVINNEVSDASLMSTVVVTDEITSYTTTNL